MGHDPLVENSGSTLYIYTIILYLQYVTVHEVRKLVLDFMKVSFFEKPTNMDGICCSSSQLYHMYYQSIYISLFIIVSIHLAPYVYTVCSVVCSVFVIMHAAELLQLFHHALPKPASCRASHVALGHCTE